MKTNEFKPNELKPDEFKPGEFDLNPDTRVILSMLKLSRALRRCPPDPAKPPFPPAIGRLLECVAAHSGVSSRELCELLDLRPSSLSEMLTRAEQEGWILRETNTEDRRLQRITLSEKGQEWVSGLKKAREADAAQKTACLTAEEKETFCALCDRLADHMETLAPEWVRRRPGPGFPPPREVPPFPVPGPEPDADCKPDAGCRPDPRPGRPPFPPETRFRC